MRIGVVGESLYGWGGGTDLLLDLGKALEYAKSVQGEKIELYLLLPNKTRLACFLDDLNTWLHENGKKKLEIVSYTNHKKQLETVIDNYKCFCPTFRIIYYKRVHFWKIDNKNRSLNKRLHQHHLSVCFPAVFYDNDRIDIPYMTYIPDFQHKYMPELFSQEECLWLSGQFQKQVMQSPNILVTSLETKNDIEKFYPGYTSKVFCMPFCPICTEKWLDEEITNVEKYNLPKDYFIISNQFWQHKSHITAFAALELLYRRGYENLHIVCTGATVDYRNNSYFGELMNTIESFRCRNNIHILGYIPKNDQIQILRNSIALIQMTLYEGNPGGNCVLDAISVGIPCIVSDIAINAEITGYSENEVSFFRTKNSASLAEKMIYILQNGKKITDKALLYKRMNENKSILAQELLKELRRMAGWEGEEV